MNIKIKFVSIILGLSLIAVIFPVGVSAALTDAQKQAIINVITSFGASQTAIDNVTISLNGGTPNLSSTTTMPTACYGITFTRILNIGSTGADVKCLQAILNQSLTTRVSPSGVGSPGYETTTFGAATKAAVIKYQALQGWNPTGGVGSKTKALLNSVLNTTNGGGVNCISNYQKKCYSNYIYWYDSCGNQQSLYQACSSNQTCSNGSCITGTALCTESNWSSTLSPTVCPSSQTQTRNWNKIGTCSGGVIHSPLSESVSCNYNIPTCTTINYSSWSTCSQSGTQTRTINSSYPTGCTGGNPILSQTCTPEASIVVKAESSETPSPIFLTLGNGASINSAGGIALTRAIDLTWSGFGLGNCTATDSLNSKIFSGGVSAVSGSQIVTLTGNIPGTSASDKVSATFTINCVTLAGVSKSDNVTVNLYYTAPGSCTPNWQATLGTCVNSQQTQTWIDINGCGSLVGKPASSTQTCTAECTDSNWKSSLSTCLSTGNQTKTWTQSGVCSGGVTHPATEVVSCTYNPVTCTSFTYTSWSPNVCPQSGIQTRTISSSKPTDCINGNPVLSQSCTPKPSIDIEAGNSDGPVSTFLTLGNGVTANQTLGGVDLNQTINLTWSGFEVSSCVASDSKTPTIFSGVVASSGFNSLILSGNIQTASGQVSDTFKITCRSTIDSSTVSDSVTVNLYYTATTNCTPNWQIGVWGACQNKMQSRTVYDSNGCFSTTNKPVTTQVCGCNISSDCGTNGWTGSGSCQSGNVYQNYITYTCSNNTCSNSTVSKLKSTCSKTCYNGVCNSCNANSDCGTDGSTGSAFCKTGDTYSVYQNYTTYTCSNHTSCTSSTTAKSIGTCSVGSCYSGICSACAQASDCGTNSIYYSCNGQNIILNYKSYTCTNPSTISAKCSSGTSLSTVIICPSSTHCSEGTSHCLGGSY